MLPEPPPDPPCRTAAIPRFCGHLQDGPQLPVARPAAPACCTLHKHDDRSTTIEEHMQAAGERRQWMAEAVPCSVVCVRAARTSLG